MSDLSLVQPSRPVRSLTFRANFLLNLLGGGLMALNALLSPMVLSRLLERSSYSAYLLGLSVAPFILSLATPIQASIAPKFASLISSGSRDGVACVKRGALRLLLIASFFGSLAAVSAAILLPVLFAWTEPFRSVASASILAVGLATALSFPTYLYTSLAAGHQNYVFDNAFKITGPYLALSAAFAATATLQTQEYVTRAYVLIGLWAFATCLSSWAIFALGAYKFSSYNARVEFAGAPNIDLRAAVRGSYLWQICALITVGSGPFVVSNISPYSVAAYSVTSSAMIVLAGVTSALTGPLSILMASHVDAAGSIRASLFRAFQAKFLAFLGFATLLLISTPTFVLALWVGQTMATQIAALVAPIASGMFLRQITGAYTAAVLGLGRQASLWLSPLAEAVTTVCASSILGHAWGVVGVAYGLLVGSALRITLTVLHDLRRTHHSLPVTPIDLLCPWIAPRC